MCSQNLLSVIFGARTAIGFGMLTNYALLAILVMVGAMVSCACSHDDPVLFGVRYRAACHAIREGRGSVYMRGVWVADEVHSVWGDAQASGSP